MADRKVNAKGLIALIKQRPKYRTAQVHHTWRPRKADFNGSNHQSLQNSMRNYHKNVRGWSDIGQHATLFPDGTFLTGRAFNRNPAGITGHNSGAFMIEMIGDFDVGEEKLEGAQLQAALEVYNYFHTQGTTIMFHREHAAKTCPGTGINKTEFMNAVRNFKSGGKAPEVNNPALSNPAPSKPSSVDGSVVDYINANKQFGSSSMANRKKLAVQYGVVSKESEYTGTAAQNVFLLSALKKGGNPSSSTGGGNTSNSAKALKKGNKVKIKSNAKKYATGESIPTRIKGKTYTIQQVRNNRVLLQEILSWVSIGDLEGQSSSTSGGSTGSSNPKVGDKVTVSRLYATGQANSPARTSSISGYIDRINGNWSNSYRLVKTKGKSDYLGFAKKQDIKRQTTGGKSSSGTPSKKSNSTIAKEVMDGKWGNNPQRKQRLEAAGYNYAAVQAEVNKLASATPKKSINQMAREIINNPKAPNGHVNRQRWLNVDKATYQKVRDRVNRLLR